MKLEFTHFTSCGDGYMYCAIDFKNNYSLIVHPNSTFGGIVKYQISTTCIEVATVTHDTKNITKEEFLEVYNKALSYLQSIEIETPLNQ